MGIPTVLICEDAFKTAAETNALMMGMPDLPLVLIPRLKVGEPRSVAERRGEEIWERLAQALVKGQPTPVSRP